MSKKQFTALYRGIELLKCENIIVNSRFENLPFQNEYIEQPGAAEGGTGIFADMKTGGFLKQVGLGQNASTATFDNCHTAIYSTGGWFSSTDNIMTHVINGIRVSDVVAQNISITFNHIEATVF